MSSDYSHQDSHHINEIGMFDTGLIVRMTQVERKEYRLSLTKGKEASRTTIRS